MKTDIIDVPDMLSVLTVDEVEKRFGDVAGVGSATVNFAAGNVTVRYDETLLEAADIKILVHQRGQQAASESQGKEESGSKFRPQPENKTEPQRADVPMPDPASGSASAPEPAAQEAAMPSPAVLPVKAQGPIPPSGEPPPPPAAAALNAETS